MLQVYVGKGENQKTFVVHESLICQKSKFFKHHAGDIWQLGDKRCFSFQWEGPDVFGLYLNLMYTGQLATKGPEEWLQLCRLYILAEQLLDVRAKNQILDGMHDLLYGAALEPKTAANMAAAIYGDVIHELYHGTTSTSKARELVVDFYANRGNHDWLRDGPLFLPMDFICDVAMRILQKRPSTVFVSSMDRAASYYHEPITADDNTAKPNTERDSPMRLDTFEKAFEFKSFDRTAFRSSKLECRPKIKPRERSSHRHGGEGNFKPNEDGAAR